MSVSRCLVLSLLIRPLPTNSLGLFPLSEDSLFTEEPDALIALVRVCGGVGGQPPALPGNSGAKKGRNRWFTSGPEVPSRFHITKLFLFCVRVCAFLRQNSELASALYL